MKKLLKYMKGYGKECVLGPLFKLLEASFELLIPLVVAGIVDTGIGAGDKSHILKMSLIMVLLGMIGLISAVVAQFFAAKAAVGFAARLRHAVMAHILHLNYTQLDKVGTSTLITRMTSDINQVQNGVNLTLRLLLRSPFVVFGAMVMAFTIDAESALVFAGIIPILCVVVFGIMLITMPAYKKVQQKLDSVTGATRENLTGVRVLRAFRMEKQEVSQFAEKTEALAAGQLQAGTVSNLMNPLTYVLINLAVILLVQVGAVKVYTGVLTQGMVIALYNYMSQILVELIKMANLILSMTKAAACAGRIQSVLDIPVTDGENAVPELGGKVEFKNVSVSYADAAAPALMDVSFTALPGQMVGIIGGTGSGKTTLVNLIPGLYTASEGSVLLDDRDVNTLGAKAVCQKIGIVPQSNLLFAGTVRDNLRWGKEDATDEEMIEALRLAQAHFVTEEKEGLDTEVEQGGRNFSGGQKQRLAIARALVRKPAILILDDSASALDYATDAALRSAIRSLDPMPTTFIVSQRAASIRHADLILVLEDGVVVGQGTSEELLKTCPVYREIYRIQFPEEVTENG
ncbi:MAG: ABC transporter ATP-binding protein [Ruminococcaceae bacterium]|nr:ABC transporter ATP-binding protein [Oscillospiraceae bacterium]